MAQPSIIREVFRPFDFDTEVSRGDAPRLFAASAVFGFALAVPGLLVGWLLTAAEQKAWGSILDPGSRYPSLVKLFFVPALLGLLIAFSGTFKSLVVFVPWLSGKSMGGWLARMALGVVLGSALGLAALWMLLVAMTQ